MRQYMSRMALFAAAAATCLIAGEARDAHSQGVIESCPITSDPTDFSGEALDLLTELKDGVVYDDSGGVGLLRLAKAGGNFRSTPLGTGDLTVFAAVADFNGDGWDDFVGAGEGTEFVRIYRNHSMEHLPVNWDDPSDILQPDFRAVRELHPAYGNHRWHPLAAGDFNGDGRPDVFWATAYTYERPYEALIWLNDGNDVNGNPTFRSPYDAMASGTSPAHLGYQNWGGTNTVALDYNGDRKLDLLVGSGETDGGAIRIFLNNCTLQNPLPDPPPPAPEPLPCADDPEFSYAGYLAYNMGMGGNGAGELPVFAYRDFDGDGNKDLVAGAPLCCSTSSMRLRLWKGEDGGGLEPTPQSLTHPGAATAVFGADFSLDGKPDVFAGSDNWNYGSNLGGKSYFYANNGTDEPFSDGVTQQITDYYAPTYDFDVGFVFDYDNDPDNTPDLMIADGNHSASFYVFANRVVTEYVPCGEVASGILDLGDLEDDEMVVTSARISADYDLNGGSITFYMSNEEPPNWVEASSCGDGSGDYCASFPKPVGREVRWRAEMCSNAFNTNTPVLTDLDMTFDYTRAVEHYRAGVVVNDGVAYVGAFRQPGDRGHFYATNAGLDTTYWDAADKLDAMTDAERSIYTANSDQDLVELSYANRSDPDLIAVLNATDEDQAGDVVNWVRSARFGIGNAGIAPSHLGAIETSTPAVVTKPGLPLWYVHAGTQDRQKVDAFISEHATRETLILFGSKDGMIHAIRNDPVNISDAANGTEAWAFIPRRIAGGMLTDYTNSLGGTLNVAHYPDGSPTVADVKLGDDEIHTVALVSSGNGGRSVAALDVTQTLDPDTNAVLGPKPMWDAQPGGGSAGQAFSKPAIGRIRIGTDEHFISVVGTGVEYGDDTRGRILHAYDLATGNRLWRFRTECALASDITMFETDDELEAGSVEIDGFMDRVVFADRCGYVYKIDPAKDLGGDWNDNSDLGAYQVENPDGVPQHAMFSTSLTPGALGIDTPVAGTIAARSDATGRVVLFFGTGGLEDFDPTLTNEFYAVYADDGSIRSKLTGTCAANGLCEKFYGGTVVTTEQVIFTRTVDPEVGTGTCDAGESTITAVKLNPDGDEEFVEDFSQSIGSAVMGALYGDAGAIYFATLSGEINRIGTPRSANAGGDTASGEGGGISEGGEGGLGTSEPMVLMGWRQVF